MELRYWARSSELAVESHCRAIGSHGPQVFAYSSRASVLHAPHCTSRVCAVPWCVHAHRAHGWADFFHGGIHPFHHTFPHTHCSNSLRRSAVNGSQIAHRTPSGVACGRIAMINSFAGVGASVPRTPMPCGECGVYGVNGSSLPMEANESERLFPRISWASGGVRASRSSRWPGTHLGISDLLWSSFANGWRTSTSETSCSGAAVAQSAAA